MGEEPGRDFEGRWSRSAASLGGIVVIDSSEKELSSSGSCIVVVDWE